jgi:hypothetical protein
VTYLLGMRARGDEQGPSVSLLPLENGGMGVIGWRL